MLQTTFSLSCSSCKSCLKVRFEVWRGVESGSLIRDVIAERSCSFNTKEGVLNSLGLTQSEFDQAVFQAYCQHKKQDCHESTHVLPVALKGRLYLLEEVADIRMYGETAVERTAREKPDTTVRNAQRRP